jgi:hypothetical protein
VFICQSPARVLSTPRLEPPPVGTGVTHRWICRNLEGPVLGILVSNELFCYAGSLLARQPSSGNQPGICGTETASQNACRGAKRNHFLEACGRGQRLDGI